MPGVALRRRPRLHRRLPSTRHRLSCAVVGNRDSIQRRDHWWTTTVPEDMKDPAAWACAPPDPCRLGGRRLSTGELPVLFRAQLPPACCAASPGPSTAPTSIARPASCWTSSATILPSFVRVHRAAHHPRGLSSAPFDGDGVATRPKDFVTNGVLTSYLLTPTPPASSACDHGDAGRRPRFRGQHRRPRHARELGPGLRDRLIGQGVNDVTSNYSRASGYWVENGVPGLPVEEITRRRRHARHLQGPGRHRQRLRLSGSTTTGSWLIDRMTVAGE